MEVQVYLENQLSENRKIGIQKTLANKDFTLVKENEAQLTFISKEQALKDFSIKAGENPEEFFAFGIGTVSQFFHIGQTHVVITNQKEH